MDNNKPYNESEQFNDLPMPDAEQSWQKMKQLLDEDNNNRRPVIPVFLKSCAGWGFLLLLTGAAAWFMLDPQKWWTGKNAESENKETKDQITKQEEQHQPSKSGTVTGENTTSSNKEIESKTNIHKSPSQTGTYNPGTVENSPGTLSSTNESSLSSHVIAKKENTKESRRTRNPEMVNSIGIDLQTKNQKTKNDETKKNESLISLVEKEKTNKETDPFPVSGIKVERPLEADTLQSAGKLQVEDSNIQTSDESKDSAQILKVDSIVTTEEKKKPKSRKALVVSAGAGMQQQIPLGQQKSVPYNYYGRKSSFYDYIPSVYVRLEKEKKWFIQGEFRYGAPQSLKEFSYSRQTKLDTALSITTTTHRLKKTYYHQFPLSFNYYILPNWSVGAGGIYSRFSGAVTEREVINKNTQTQVETVSREIVNIRHFTDSFLYKTQVHFLFQTEYHWNRLTFGLRFTSDVQPFIKYTRPDGQVNVEKNQTLQMLVRFRIWQSKK